jgi:SAM-dependent methyltransferase
MRDRLRSLARLFLPPPATPQAPTATTSAPTNEQYWDGHNVTLHQRFKDAQESLEYFHWRNDQYPGYIDLMPVAGRDGKVVLDFGCGPGNDLVGFAAFSKPARLIGLDLSATSLEEARSRLALHGATAELIVAQDGAPIPLPDASIDVLHCSGVLHHARDSVAVLREFRRVLKPGGEARLMVYNRESVWLHLYVAYVLMLTTPAHAGLSLEASFQRSTDGPGVPVSRCWTVAAFKALAAEAGFRCEHLGNAVSLHELSLLPRRFDAMQLAQLPREHREFLRDLTIDEHGRPLHAGQMAGIDACYRLMPS